MALVGAMIGEQTLTVLSLGEFQAARSGAQCLTGNVANNVTKINPKIYNQLEKQLQQAGAKSILKALRSAERTLKFHQDKLASLQYRSQVEGTIRNVESQIKTLKQFIKDYNL